MRIGLVSVQTSHSAHAESGALPPAAAMRLALWQASFCHSAGCSSVILAVTKIDSHILRLQSEAEALGITASVAVGPPQLQQQVLGADELLVLAEDRYFSPEMVEIVSYMVSGDVLVLENAASDQGFERIDSTHHWAGISLIAPEQVSALQGMPEDWAWDSALLRQAVQAGARRRPIPAQHVQDRHLVVVQDLVTFGEIEDARRAMKAGTFQRGPVETVVRSAIDDLVDGRRLADHLESYRFLATLIGAMASVATGYLGWTITSFLLYLASSMIWLGHERSDRLDERIGLMDEIAEASPVLLLGVLVVFASAHQNLVTFAVAGFVGITFAGLVWLIQPHCTKGSFFSLVGDHIALGAMFVILAALGASVYLAMVISLICLGQLIRRGKFSEKSLR